MSFKSFARAPAASGQGKGTRSVANPGERGIPAMAPRAPANSRGDTLSNPYGKTAFFSTKSSFSPIRTEKRPISVRIRVGPYTTRSQTSTKHASSTSTNHSLLTLAISSFPNVTNRELKLRGRAIFFLTLHVRKTGIVHRYHREEQNRVGKCHGGSGIALFQIVLGLMCSGGLSGGGESQNEAKSRRFGMDQPSRAFYEG